MTSFVAKISGGNLDFGSDYNAARFRQFCKENEGKHLKIEKVIPIRSLTQNAFYWAWLSKVEIETGNDKEDLHEYLKTRFLPKRILKIRGKKKMHQIATTGSTTRLSKVEFGEYLEKCASHTGIPLPTEEEIAEMGYLKR